MILLIHFKFKFLGQVAFIGGGWPSRRSVEVYSPNGDCQHLLAPLPIQMESYIMRRYSDSVIACAGNLFNICIFLC